MPLPNATPLTARIVQWDRQKGYGFLLVGKKQLFLHRRDFEVFRKPPAVGDKIRFMLGDDSQGRICAKKAVHVHGLIGVTVVGVLVPLCLLLLPVFALRQRGVDYQWIAIYGVVLSLMTYWAYAHDKRSAKKGAWRVSEVRLHLLELLGGWPGAFFAQQQLRHKCSKWRYQCVFWLILVIYQLVAFDALENWKFSNALVNQLKTL